MGKVVKTIEPIRKQILQDLRPKLKVCAYCRVSTDSTKQHKSYIAQAEHYESHIKANEQWEYVGIYADESSGTKVKNRDDFSRMISDCERGKINLIITKSITRFARNTVDLIDTVRSLKAMGVDVYFEKEKINTLSTQSELMISIFSSIAQREAENISENARWMWSLLSQTDVDEVWAEESSVAMRGQAETGQEIKVSSITHPARRSPTQSHHDSHKQGCRRC